MRKANLNSSANTKQENILYCFCTTITNGGNKLNFVIEDKTTSIGRLAI